jgi:hypothetical protein
MTKPLVALTTAAAMLIAAPAASAQDACGTHSGRGCAPQTERVDTTVPIFSNPTRITNPLFPISDLHSVVLLGHVDGKPFRTETTLLPQTETVQWRGQAIEVLVSQYLAYRDGHITEVALDRYAQDDDGSVWYFGEDVFDYTDGTVSATEGTWLAGRDGPPAMIMPAQPAVGDVYRPENAPNIVFEEVTVKSVDETVDGPFGSVDGGLVVDELHSDGSHEPKVFAPGYGEFRTSGGGDLEALTLAVPADALDGLPSVELNTLHSGAIAILEAARLAEWEGGAATIDRIDAAWDVVKGDEPPPKPIAALVTKALRDLRSAVAAHEVAATSQGALDLAQSALDLELRHRTPAEVDAARFELWTQQLRVDAAKNDHEAVAADVAALEWIRDRFVHVMDTAGQQEIDDRLRDLRTAVDSGALEGATDRAARLGARIRHLVERQPVS